MYKPKQHGNYGMNDKRIFTLPSGRYIMKKITAQIPNTLTAANLFFGVIGITFALRAEFETAFYCMVVSAIFDFFDGFVARLLNVSSPLGKELDSLADVVTFGVLPGLMLLTLYQQNVAELQWLAYITILVPVFSAFRLAIFNLDTTQTDHFRGLATPGNALFLGALVCWAHENTTWSAYYVYAIPALSVLMSLLLVSRIPLLALKFKAFSKPAEWLKISFPVLALLLAIFLKFAAAAVIMPLYFVISFIYFKIDEI